MNIEDFRAYCLNKKGATEDTPFDETTLVFKVMGKMFSLTSLDKAFSINLKFDPSLAQELRDRYPVVKPGYHMNKKHWNTIMMDGSVSDDQLKKWVDHSYNLVIDKLTKSQKELLNKQ